MADDRGDVLKGLGVRRRRKPDPDEAVDADEADEAPKKSDSLGLGIKRRRKPGESSDDAKPASGGTGLGIKRRKKSGEQPAATSSGLGIKRRSGRAEAVGEEPAAPAPVQPWKGKLGSDDTAVMLANHFKARPKLAATLPVPIWDLYRTHGRYLGDGRPERKIQCGWEPAFVLYTLPSYPDGAPQVDPKTSKFVFPNGTPAYDPKTRTILEPGPNRQPAFAEDGFVVRQHLNEAGEWWLEGAHRQVARSKIAAMP